MTSVMIDFVRLDGIYRKVRDRITQQLEKIDATQHPWASILAAGPELFLLVTRLVRDPRVPLKQKAKLAAAAAYFLSPIELLPEVVLGPIGLIDDIAFVAYALHSVINEIDPAIVEEHWTGKEEALRTIKAVLADANRALGSGVWGKVARRFRRSA